jgi:hypothetical protein
MTLNEFAGVPSGRNLLHANDFRGAASGKAVARQVFPASL